MVGCLSLLTTGGTTHLPSQSPSPNPCMWPEPPHHRPRDPPHTRILSPQLLAGVAPKLGAFYIPVALILLITWIYFLCAGLRLRGSPWHRAQRGGTGRVSLEPREELRVPPGSGAAAPSW